MNYVLTEAAEADLLAIFLYTRKQWGTAQAQRYAAKLKACMTRLAAGRGAFRSTDSLYPGLRVLHCEHHYLFCLPSEEAPSAMVAILHERMDIITRVAARLQTPQA